MRFTTLMLLYNFLSLLLGVILLPPALILILARARYRGRIRGRLGFDLPRRLGQDEKSRPVIWIHALSAGEVTSSRSILRELRGRLPGATICLSTTTRAGEIASRALAPLVDVFLPFPLDFPWVVARFQKHVDPDLFVLVETDYWPNFLHGLMRKNVPAFLVNGRISAVSAARYQKYALLFHPLFSSFRILFMQREQDMQQMHRLGIAPDKIVLAGNLKCDSVLGSAPGRSLPDRAFFFIPDGVFLWVCGSTHEGEEEVIFSVYTRLAALSRPAFLVIAPRNPERGGEIAKLAAKLNIGHVLRKEQTEQADASVLILDTLGELEGLYSLCDAAFVGGSLVPEGGHNILEPAAFGKPVAFGPFMHDFHDLGRDLLDAGGAVMAKGEDDLFRTILAWHENPARRRETGERARRYVDSQRGSAKRHVDRILPYIARQAGL